MAPTQPQPFRPLRIALWTGRYPQWSERFIARDVDRLAGLGHEVHLFPCENPAAERSWRRIGDAGPRTPPRADPAVSFSRPAALDLLFQVGWTQTRRWPLLSRAARMWAGLAEGPPDVVVSQFAGLPTVLGAAFALGWGRPLLVCVHARDVWVPWPPGWRALSRARLVVGCNRAVLDELARREAVPPDRLRLVHHGLDFDPLFLKKAKATRTSEDTGRARVLFVGRMVEKKGLPLLFEAVRRLPDTVPPFELELVGDGPQVDRLWKLANALPVPVHFTGRLDEVDVVARMKAADVLVQPSVVAADGDRDGIPNAVLEAMGVATPVVTTTAAGGAEALGDDEQAGWLCAPDADSLAAALRAALSDPVERRRRGRVAATRVRERFDGPTSTRQLDECLRDCLTPPAEE